MRIVRAGYEIMTPIQAEDIYRTIEKAGRTCYKSEALITEDSAEKFVRGLVKRGHEAMLEHESITVRFTVDRGVSHEIVRHRLSSFAQESTRYCNYSQDKFGEEITVIEPCFFDDIPKEERGLCCLAVGFYSTWPIRESLENLEGSDEVFEFISSGKITPRHRAYSRWYDSCCFAETNYFEMLKSGCTPEEARSVLPNSLKTELVMTANLREWRHFLKLRAAGTTGKPHPQMAEVAVPLLKELQQKLPAVFDDI